MKNVLRRALICSIGACRQRLRIRTRKRIIALHDIEDAYVFQKKMDWLKENYTVLSMDALLTAPADCSRTQIAITFDDGYDSWHRVAAPILRELKMPAVFFVCSGFVGRSASELVRFVERCLRRTRELRPLTVSQLQELADDDLFEIGGHTVHHVDLGTVRDQKTFEQEIRADRQQLQDWTHAPVKWFAYPFGGPRHCSTEAIDYLKNASGYHAAFTIVPGESVRSDDYLIHRDCLDLEASDRLWSAWLNGSYDALYQLARKVSPK